MTVLNDCIYKNLARILTSAVGRVEFFNGAVTLTEDETTITLRSTLLVYRRKNMAGHDPTDIITKIVPVWYECTTTEYGAVTANEFSWEDFKIFLPAQDDVP